MGAYSTNDKYAALSISSGRLILVNLINGDRTYQYEVHKAAGFYEKEQYQVTIEVLQRAPLRKRKLDDDLKEIHYNLAAAYEKTGDEKKALRHYKRVYSNAVNFLDVKERVENKEYSSI